MENIEEINRVCPVCEQESHDFWFKPPQSPGPVVQCKNCGFVFVTPIQSTQALIDDDIEIENRTDALAKSSNLEDIRGSWEESAIQSHMRETTMKRLNALDALAHLEQLIPHRGRLLDFGCFCGIFLNTAREKGWDCFGLEPLTMPAIYARGHYGLDVLTDTLRENSYPAEHFDVVTAFQVFEHLIYPEKEIEKIHTILKPGGFLLIEVPNIDTRLVKTLKTKHRHFVQDHVSFFSIKTLSQLLEANGFDVKESFFPTRVLSLTQFIWWIGKYNKGVGSAMRRVLPNQVLNRPIRVNFREIITVIAQKREQ